MSKANGSRKGVSLHRIESKTRHVQVRVDEEDDAVLEVDYRPAAYTPEFEAKVNEGVKANDSYVLGWMVAQLVADWDLYEDDAMTEKVALTPERLRKFPVHVLSRVMQGVAEDVRPNRTSAGPSETGSLE